MAGLPSTTDTAACLAVVARALGDAAFLDMVRTEPDRAWADLELPADARRGLEGLDAERLALIASFVCKVKHNDLWEHLPRTRALLHTRGDELGLFAAYARWPRANVDRPGEFVAFLLDHLSSTGRATDVVGDVARHELIVHRLRSERTDAAGPPPQPGVPAARGRLVVARFSNDPTEPGDRPSGDDGPPGDPVFVAYGSSGPGDGPRVFHVDPLTALVLNAIDGRRSVEEIRATIGMEDQGRAVAEVVRRAAELGLVTLPPEPDAGDRLHRLFEGYFATRALHAAHRTGVLAHLGRPAHAAEVATALGLDVAWLTGLLDFLARRTPAVERRPDGRYVATALGYERLGFALDKFVGAYGPCLDHDGPAPDAVDGTALAGAFAAVDRERIDVDGSPSITVLLLEQWRVATDVVDLGCGTGGLLRQLAARTPAFRGLGIDANPSMCAAAADDLRRRGLSDRVTIAQGDARLVVASLSAARRASVTALHGRSFLNACFADGAATASAIVRILVQAFPGRLLFVDDYYGELGRGRAARDGCWAELQDVVQAWSGQGIPPSDRRGWADMYANGGASLRHSYEDDIDGFRRFIHVVELGEVHGT